MAPECEGTGSCGDWKAGSCSFLVHGRPWRSSGLCPKARRVLLLPAPQIFTCADMDGQGLPEDSPTSCPYSRFRPLLDSADTHTSCPAPGLLSSPAPHGPGWGWHNRPPRHLPAVPPPCMGSAKGGSAYLVDQAPGLRNHNQELCHRHLALRFKVAAGRDGCTRVPTVCVGGAYLLP